jgi:hypothetical protein
MKPPAPLCLVFQPCDRVVDHDDHGTSIDHIVRRLIGRTFPLAHKFGFYVSCISGHGVYQLEIQLQEVGGDVVWRGGPPFKVPMQDPVEEYDIKLNLAVVIRKPGIYEFILLANGEEIARRKFKAELSQELAERS